jgi:hypothetical protein
MGDTATVTRGCVNPIRLHGFYQRISADTGEVLALLGSPEPPRGTLLVACKDRRASCCEVCATRYQRDAYQLIASGLRGGKTVPRSVGSHPALTLTLTAPSFGSVHRNRGRRQPCGCGRYHDPDDPQLGAAIEPASYHYTEQVVWNHLAPELWKRTVLAIRRALAQALGIRRANLSRVVRLRFGKVAEFQRRGVIHYHAIIRVDGPDRVDQPPPPQLTTDLLEHVVNAATDAASITPPAGITTTGITRPVGWGPQRELVALDQHTCTKAASYIAKYAAKATETTTGGRLVKPLRSLAELSGLDLPDHARRLIAASWVIAERTEMRAFKRWAHQFGYGGHTLTKSRDYSVTFAALRAARVEWYQQSKGDVIVRAKLTYAGRGYS